jgi:hypothetical protein
LKTVFIFYPVLVPFRSHPFGFFVGARENKGMGAEKRGILLFRFLTSNETEMISMKKLKIRLEIKLTQVYFFKKKSRFPSPSRSTAKKGQSGLICIRSSRLSKDFFNRPKDFKK